MTDIRRHGFESDAQWREYLAEIEDATVGANPAATEQHRALRDLAELRAQVDALRQRVHDRAPFKRPTPRWRLLGAGLFLLLLAAAAR
jgi:hypothetical protein